MPEDIVTTPIDGFMPASPQPRARLGRIVLSIREHPSMLRQTSVIAVSVLIGLVISCLILIVAGVPADDLVDEFIVQTLLDAENLRGVLAQAAPLILVAVGAALAFRVNFWNLGLGGQMICGGAAATGVFISGLVPDLLMLPAMFVAACIAGMLWALLPTLLKLRLGISETISTLLLNYVAQNLLFHLLYGPWMDHKDNFPHSEQFTSSGRLPEVFWGINAALPLAVVVGVIAWWLVSQTRLGVYMRFVQANPRMAYATGVPLAATTIAAVLVSASCAGLAGFVVVSGLEGRLTQSVSNGYGVSGVLIAFMARNNPVAAVLVAFLVATLFVTSQSLQVFYQIPFAMVQTIQAIIVICVAASDFLIRHRVRFIR